MLFAAFIALGLYSQTIHDATLDGDLSAITREIYGRLAFNGVAGLVPGLGALIMIWIAFASPRWSDRLLWSTAMIFTAELGAGANYFFSRAGLSGTLHTYPSSYAVTGLVAYASWLLMIDRGTLPRWAKATLGVLCILALLSIVAYPWINPYLRPVDTVGSGLFAAALFSLGLFVAQRVGVNLFGRDEAERDDPRLVF